MIFSEKLQLIRKSKGLTREELAKKLSVSRQAVAKWESGQSDPDIENLHDGFRRPITNQKNALPMPLAEGHDGCYRVRS